MGNEKELISTPEGWIGNPKFEKLENYYGKLKVAENGDLFFVRNVLHYVPASTGLVRSASLYGVPEISLEDPEKVIIAKSLVMIFLSFYDVMGMYTKDHPGWWKEGSGAWLVIDNAFCELDEVLTASNIDVQFYGSYEDAIKEIVLGPDFGSMDFYSFVSRS